MIRAALDRIADALWLLAGALVLTLGARAEYVAMTTPGAASADQPAAATSRGARRQREPEQVARHRRGPERATPGATITTQIIVEGAGPRRATVQVDGAAVGQTPYIGDVTCRVGEPVRVEIVGSGGERRAYEVPCRDDVLRLPTTGAR